MDITVAQPQGCPIARRCCRLAEGRGCSSESASELGCGPGPCFTDGSTGDWGAAVFHRSMLAEGARASWQSDSPTDSRSHSLSPISSVDSCCRLSPPHVPGTSPAERRGSTGFPSPRGSRHSVGRWTREVRWPRGPAGTQRQSASEREKLRMRVLAKALHNLRTYLPPSVAPAAQSLTKLETLRLTIHYIAHLTDVLALGQEMPTLGGGAVPGRAPTGTTMPTARAASPSSHAIISLPSTVYHPPATVTCPAPPGL